MGDVQSIIGNIIVQVESALHNWKQQNPGKITIVDKDSYSLKLHLQPDPRKQEIVEIDFDPAFDIIDGEKVFISIFSDMITKLFIFLLLLCNVT